MIKVDNKYMIKIRRELHQYPEIDFDLPKTVALIKRELDSLGIEYTEKYSEGSVVGYINPQISDFTIGIRADTDALKITETSGLPFASKHTGKMHACGHDAHTAVLLGVAKALKAMENSLKCRVALVFQPSEEGLKSGAMAMIENGLMEDIDIILGMHADVDIKTGELGICPGYAQASSRHLTINVEGVSAHAASPQTGTDALAIAVRLYNDLHVILNREISPKENYICSINSLESGTSFNIVPDKAVLKGTIRTFDVNLSEFLFERIKRLAESIAMDTGGKIDVVGPLKSLPLYNNPELSSMLIKSMEKIVGADKVHISEKRYGSEDFSRMAAEKPAAYFRLGVRNEKIGSTKALHHSDFILDEDAMEFGCKAIIQFVLDNQMGVDMKKIKASDER